MFIVSCRYIPGVALLLASAPNTNAAEMGGRGLRGVNAMTMDAVDADAAVSYRRYLQAEAETEDEEVNTTNAIESSTNAFEAEEAEVGEGERTLDYMGDGTFCVIFEGI